MSSHNSRICLTRISPPILALQLNIQFKDTMLPLHLSIQAKDPMQNFDLRLFAVQVLKQQGDSY